jgi:ABC-type sugar transport system substrate-binding protein
MVKRVLLAVGTIASLVAIAACGSSDNQATGSTGSAAKSGGGKKITVIMPSLANDAYLLEKAGAEAEAKQLPGQKVSIVTGTGSSSSELVNKVEDAVTRGTDVIAINAGDPKPVIPALKRAIQQGVKVVVFDVPIPELTDQSSFVGLDNRQGGELAGKWLAAHAGKGGQLGILHCIPGLEITDDRVAGFKAGLGGAPFKVVSTLDAKCDREKGRTTMENMLSAHPDLSAIYSISDTQTFGAVKAIQAVHKDPIVVSFDAQPEALKDIQSGTVIDASVGQFPFKVGALAVKTAVSVAEGKSVPKQVISPLIMVDKTNVAQFTADQRKLP